MALPGSFVLGGGLPNAIFLSPTAKNAIGIAYRPRVELRPAGTALPTRTRRAGLPGARPASAKGPEVACTRGCAAASSSDRLA